MRKLLITLACMAGLGYQASAISLIIGDEYYVGRVEPGKPSSPSDEVVYINYLITLIAGTGPVPFEGQNYDRIDSDSPPLLPSSLPEAVLDGAYKDDEAPFPAFDATDFGYVLGKYDESSAGIYVWYNLNGDFDDGVSLPAEVNGKALSHQSAYFAPPDFPPPPPPPVPDAGTTLVLMGAGLFGLGLLGRRRA